MRRARRPAPLIFYFVALVSLLGGALNTSLNGDTLSYRLPRVLHWLAQGRWHWIRTLDERMNYAGCGFEWLSAPMILFTRSDRMVFLINWISFLLLPGLIFGVFRRIGVRGRVSWWWMWILPCGWCYALQAGSTVTDSYIAVFALAAVEFALRAGEDKRLSDAWLSMLAAGLLTGTKQTGLPLALLWLLAFWPVRALLRQRLLPTAAIAGWALIVSAAPIAFFNLRQYGRWNGNMAGYELNSPFWGIVGNSFCLLVQNLLPGFFPWSATWNHWMEQFQHSALGHHFAMFEEFGHLGRAANERSAGMGLPVVLLAVVSWWVARSGMTAGRRSVNVSDNHRAPEGAMSAGRRKHALSSLIRVAPVVPLLLLMAKDGTYENARHLSPYYIFFFPSLLAMRGQAEVVRKTAWRLLALAAMLSVFVLFAMSHERPLLPIRSLTVRLLAHYPASHFLQAVDQVFSVHSSLMVLRHPFPEAMPLLDETILGYATSSGWAEPGLWLPFGPRRVERILPDDSPERLLERSIHYVILDDEEEFLRKKSLTQWLTDLNGQLLKEVSYQLAPGVPANHLYFIRLRPATVARSCFPGSVPGVY